MQHTAQLFKTHFVYRMQHGQIEQAKEVQQDGHLQLHS